MTKGQLPKAYLRMDPNLDQVHPDPGGFVRLLCAAARQPQRGRFSSRALLDGILGKGLVNRLALRKDIVPIDDGKWYVAGWDEWQEGDLTVGERQRRIRDRRVTSPLPDRDSGVTPPVVDRDPPSRQRDSKTGGFRQESRSKENPAIAALLARRWPKVTQRQRDMLWEIADRHDDRGHEGEWAAAIIEACPENVDPIATVKNTDAAWQRDRRSEADAAEKAWAAEKAAERVN